MENLQVIISSCQTKGLEMMRKSSLLTAKLAATTFFPGIVRKGGPLVPGGALMWR